MKQAIYATRTSEKAKFSGLEFWADYLPAKRGRPSEGTDAVTIRLPKNIIQAIEEARILARPIPSRTDVIREAVEFWLKSKGLLT
jgi:hypothetical protein